MLSSNFAEGAVTQQEILYTGERNLENKRERKLDVGVSFS